MRQDSAQPLARADAVRRVPRDRTDAQRRARAATPADGPDGATGLHSGQRRRRQRRPAVPAHVRVCADQHGAVHRPARRRGVFRGLRALAPGLGRTRAHLLPGARQEQDRPEAGHQARFAGHHGAGGRAAPGSAGARVPPVAGLADQGAPPPQEPAAAAAHVPAVVFGHARPQRVGRVALQLQRAVAPRTPEKQAQAAAALCRGAPGRAQRRRRREHRARGGARRAARPAPAPRGRGRGARACLACGACTRGRGPCARGTRARARNACVNGGAPIDAAVSVRGDARRAAALPRGRDARRRAAAELPAHARVGQKHPARRRGRHPAPSPRRGDDHLCRERGVHGRGRRQGRLPVHPRVPADDRHQHGQAAEPRGLADGHRQRRAHFPHRRAAGRRLPRANGLRRTRRHAPHPRHPGAGHRQARHVPSALRRVRRRDQRVRGRAAGLPRHDAVVPRGGGAGGPARRADPGRHAAPARAADRAGGRRFRARQARDTDAEAEADSDAEVGAPPARAAAKKRARTDAPHSSDDDEYVN